MSESIEMYLLRIALLQQEAQAQHVPVPKLAQELAVSPVSANEMCRKLTEKELITYEPYKGVQLTASGQAMARRVIRRRRLWEVFFVEKLGLTPAEAEEMACRFEHVTSDSLANRLDNFLENPTRSPQNKPIPDGSGAPVALPSPQPLAALPVGTTAVVAGLNVEAVTAGFLQQQGVLAGSRLAVLAAAADGSRLLAVAGQPVSLAGAIAAKIEVFPAPELQPDAQSISSSSGE